MKNFILFLLVILLAVIPFFIQKDAAFLGSDGQAEETITEVSPNYVPWVNSIWEPPSGEIESLLFALQAAIGAIVIGYFFGYARARKKYNINLESKKNNDFSR